jgi:antirestriction protein ArdC
MSRLRTPKVSHLVGRQRAVARSAAWSLFRPGETRLPYGYRAEISAAYLCASLNITPTVRHADYIGSWLDVLREDNRAIVRAASAASKAADYILGFQSENSEANAISADDERAPA